jgi:hypothetical protein
VMCPRRRRISKRAFQTARRSRHIGTRGPSPNTASRCQGRGCELGMVHRSPVVPEVRGSWRQDALSHRKRGLRFLASSRRLGFSHRPVFRLRPASRGPLPKRAFWRFRVLGSAAPSNARESPRAHDVSVAAASPGVKRTPVPSRLGARNTLSVTKTDTGSPSRDSRMDRLLISQRRRPVNARAASVCAYGSALLTRSVAVVLLVAGRRYAQLSIVLPSPLERTVNS